MLIVIVVAVITLNTFSPILTALLLNLVQSKHTTRVKITCHHTNKLRSSQNLLTGLVSRSIPNVLTDNRVDQISSSRKIIKVIIFSLHSIELFLAVDQCVCRNNLCRNVRFYTYNLACYLA